MALILRYFTELLYDVVIKQLLPQLQNLLLIVYGHINTIFAIIQRLFEQKRGGNSLLLPVVAYSPVS